MTKMLIKKKQFMAFGLVPPFDKFAKIILNNPFEIL